MLLGAPLISWEGEREFVRGMRERKPKNLGVGVLCGPCETTLNLWLTWTRVETLHRGRNPTQMVITRLVKAALNAAS